MIKEKIVFVCLIIMMLTVFLTIFNEVKQIDPSDITIDAIKQDLPLYYLLGFASMLVIIPGILASYESYYKNKEAE